MSVINFKTTPRNLWKDPPIYFFEFVMAPVPLSPGLQILLLQLSPFNPFCGKHLVIHLNPAAVFFLD
jgi:hypothetical protein